MRNFIFLIAVITFIPTLSYAEEDIIKEPEYYVLYKSDIGTLLIDQNSIIPIESKSPKYLAASTRWVNNSSDTISNYALYCGKREFHEFHLGDSVPSDILRIYGMGGFYKITPGTNAAYVYNFACNPNLRKDFIQNVQKRN